MKIRSQPTNDNYRNNWDTIFKKEKECNTGKTGLDPLSNNQDGLQDQLKELFTQLKQHLK